MEWSSVFAGAVGASAISFLLLTFGAAVGMTLTSPLPEASGLSVWGMVLATAWWAVMVEIGSFFAGGYLAGRMRMRWGTGSLDESRFRDGAHGFMVWAVGVVVGALLLAFAGATTLKTGAQAASILTGGAVAAAGQSNPGADYATDMLLRPMTRATPAPTPLGANAQAAGSGNSQDNQALRNEVRRIFGSTISNRELTARDRDYLGEVVASRTGLSQAEAQSRVDSTVQDVQKFEQQARQKAETARKYALISGFLAAAALLIGLAAAVGGANLGGRHRDEGTVAHLFGHRFW
jgi:hypothetical protein